MNTCIHVLDRQSITLLLLGALIMSAESDPEGLSVTDWPIIAPNGSGELRLYHPQVESLKGDRMTARAACSITSNDGDKPTFGVIWLAARAETDRDARTITLSGQAVSKIHLLGASDQEEAAVSTIATTAISGLHPVLSLDRILSSLRDADRDRQYGENLGTAPPKIIVVQHPAALLYVDGEPLGEAMAGTRFERIQNTPFHLVRDPADGACWLRYGGRWYDAPAITGPWTVSQHPSDDMRALIPLLQGATDPDSEVPIEDPVDIVVSLEPAELVSSEGPLAYEPIADTRLLAVTNSENDLFLETASQRHFLLLAGRWFSTGDLVHGPWQSVPSAALPADFSRIPPESAYGTILANVPGTEMSDEASLDAQVPQTAEVKRDATITVTYDGDPLWLPIAHTAMSYASNSPQAVIRTAESEYYCCEAGIWYRAATPLGPWSVAVSLPPDIGSIPPDNPLYNTRYVYIYDTTPEYVYVGYSSGYLGGYVLNGSVVWGTGYQYRNWRGRHYYARPITWGCGMAYNPWIAHWGGTYRHGAGGARGGYVGGAGDRHGGWWGPGGYAQSMPRHGQTDRHGQPGAIIRTRPGATDVLIHPTNDNLYRRPENHDRVQNRPDVQPPARPRGPGRGPSPPAGRTPDHVLPGKDGEVFRRHGDGWQQWKRDGWTALPRDTDRGQDRPKESLPSSRREPAPPAKAGIPQPGAGDHPSQPARDGSAARRPDPVETRQAKPPVRNELPRADPPPSRVDQLDRQLRSEDRGVQRSQQFRTYRAERPEAGRRPVEGKPRP